MQTVIIVIHLIVVATMIGVVLLQKSEGGGLGIGGGGGGGFLLSRGAANLRLVPPRRGRWLSSPPAWSCRSLPAGTASRGRSSRTPAPRRNSRCPAAHQPTSRGRGAGYSIRCASASNRRRRHPARRCRGRNERASVQGPGGPAPSL